MVDNVVTVNNAFIVTQATDSTVRILPKGRKYTTVVHELAQFFFELQFSSDCFVDPFSLVDTVSYVLVCRSGTDRKVSKVI
jgi:hypothetical protein